MKKEPIKYRGVRTGLIVGVLEGNGTDIPYELIEYVIVGGQTLGKIVPLTPEERALFDRP